MLEKFVEQVRVREGLPSPAARRAIRVAARASLQEFGDVVGVSHEAVRLWELGRRRPSAANAARYSELLDRLRKEIG
jgi:DNA-binding transcriptional regulator YiaG